MKWLREVRPSVKVQAMVGLWDADARRWSVWLENTSIDTCTSLFMPSHPLFFGSMESAGGSCRGRERDNGRDGEMSGER